MFDILIKNCTAVTINRKREILESCDIGIQNGNIIEIGKLRGAEAAEVIEGAGSYALPGLINCHTHVYQSLIEGIGYDMHFNPWNHRYLIPIISRMRPEHARASAELAALEMIRSGTTAFSDHWYLHTDFENIGEVADAFHTAGLRSHIVFGFLNESFAGRKNENSGKDVLKGDEVLLGKAREFVQRWHGKGLVTAGLGPGSTEDVSRGLFEGIIGLARDLDVLMVTHIAGWIEIISRSLEKYGMRDLEYAASLGFTGPKAVALHCVWLSDDEIRMAAEEGTKVVHNPVANMHLGYGMAPVREMLSRGVTVGLGTDGAASYTYDMFEIGKTAAMLQKVRKLDAEALTAERALELLTLGGAEVLELEGKTGSLEPGKKADIILVKTGKPHLLGGGRPAPQLVYSARGSDVETSIIDGKIVMRDGKVLSLDERRVLETAQKMREELFLLGGEETAYLLGRPWGSERASWRSG